MSMPPQEQEEEDFGTVLRRNTYSKFSANSTSTCISNQDTIPERTVCDSPVLTHSSPECHRIVSQMSSRLNPKAFNALNSFDDRGHLSNTLFNQGDNHLTSEDFDKSLGYQQMFENKLEVTAITATTIASCLSSILLELIVQGENMTEEGHCNGVEFDIFCG